MSYMKGDYISSDDRYGKSRSGCFAFIEETSKNGDIFISTIGVYGDIDKETEVFRFNVGTLSDNESEIFLSAQDAYLTGFDIFS